MYCCAIYHFSQVQASASLGACPKLGAGCVLLLDLFVLHGSPHVAKVNRDALREDGDDLRFVLALLTANGPFDGGVRFKGDRFIFPKYCCPDYRHSRKAGIQLSQRFENMDPRFREDDSLVRRKSASIEREFGLIIGAIAAMIRPSPPAHLGFPSFSFSIPATDKNRIEDGSYPRQSVVHLELMRLEMIWNKSQLYLSSLLVLYFAQRIHRASRATRHLC